MGVGVGVMVEVGVGVIVETGEGVTVGDTEGVGDEFAWLSCSEVGGGVGIPTTTCCKPQPAKKMDRNNNQRLIMYR